MKCSVFIATSADGYIADKDGGVAWLDSAGKPDADLGDEADMGMNAYMASIDCIIMGRKCMDSIWDFNLSPDQWPYGDTRIIVLSNTVKEAPGYLKKKMEMYSGGIPNLIARLESEGHRHAYVDGGKTIQSFLNLELIDEITITQAPVLLGAGTPLFGELDTSPTLQQANAKAFPNDFVQISYGVVYDKNTAD